MVYDDTGTAYIKRGEGDLENYPAASSNRGGGNKDLTDHSPLKPIFSIVRVLQITAVHNKNLV